MTESNKTLAILRGISGSGKSHKAAEILKPTLGVCVSADFFWGRDYKFNGSYIGIAHEWCLGEVVRNMLYDVTPIVVDNTNTVARDAEKYVWAARKFGYDIAVFEPDTPWKFDIDECYRRNTHKVPRDVIARMLNRWEKEEVFKQKLKI